MSQQTKQKPVCQECGSDDVSFDAAAVWNQETQEYELSSTFDSGGCRNFRQEFKHFDWIDGSLDDLLNKLNETTRDVFDAEEHLGSDKVEAARMAEASAKHAIHSYVSSRMHK